MSIAPFPYCGIVLSVHTQSGVDFIDTTSSVRHKRPGLHPPHRRPLLRQAAGRLRRGGHKGRTSRDRRRRPRHRSLPQRHAAPRKERDVPSPEHQQALHNARPQDQRRAAASRSTSPPAPTPLSRVSARARWTASACPTKRSQRPTPRWR